MYPVPVPEFWRGEEFVSLKTISSFDELATIGVRVISRLPEPVVEVCGPITTGGRGSLKENLHVFEHVTMRLGEDGYHVFNLLNFQPTIDRLAREWAVNNQGYCWPILNIFFRQVFDAKKINFGYFIPGWESSVGARWEREALKVLGVVLREVPEEMIPRRLQEES